MRPAASLALSFALLALSIILTLIPNASAIAEGQSLKNTRPMRSKPQSRCWKRTIMGDYVQLRANLLIDGYYCTERAFSQLAEVFSDVSFITPIWDDATKRCKVEAHTYDVDRALSAFDCYLEEPLTEDDCFHVYDRKPGGGGGGGERAPQDTPQQKQPARLPERLPIAS